MASKGVGPLPRRRGSALARGCERGGRVVLPLARAAAVSTGLRVREGGGGQRARRRADGGRDARVVVRDLEQSRAAGLAHLALYGEQRLAPARLAARRDQLDGVAAWLG